MEANIETIREERGFATRVAFEAAAEALGVRHVPG